ncbi:MAG: PAS domain S-box protein [Bacteroidetes bacterium]|nr:MAG: PAS domain S-box protein [Bacteroidota bacterium]MBL1144993.1 PAS domain S-box protein [Bacteroidota bacterium]NOG57789.1 PAS domain S-box protein [Bacteroidota bacterium]
MDNKACIDVLLIESIESDALVIGELLDSSVFVSYNIFHVSSLKESIAFLSNNTIDIILVDLFLDDSFGIHTFDNLFKQFPNLPFIALTDIDDDAIGRSAVKRGAQDYIVKSILETNLLNRAIFHSIERKQTEEELRKSEEKYRELFLRSKDAIYMSTVEGDFIDINPAGLALFGYALDDLRTLKVKDLYVNERDRIQLIEELNTKGEVEDYEIVLVKKDKATRLHCLLTTLVIYDNNNQVIGFQGIIKDFTEKKNAEDALVKSLQDLDQANKELNYLNATLEEKVVQRTLELKKKMAIVANQNKAINESINYAKRIQASILPDGEKIKKYLPNSFIYYRPKDIVSGDFYWFDELDGNPMFAVVDCTGHGVPGAFMSIIGYTQLNEIIGHMKITTPGKVLKELDKRVRIALKQNSGIESNSKDGMELGLISIDYENNLVHFSGAMRPMYFVRNGELSILKGDKFSIGGTSLRSKNFTTHTIQVKKGDSIYLFSDGYPDQFGGGYGKKFMTKNVVAMVTKIAHLEMAEQGKIVKSTIMTWMENEDQIDDILFAGIKF